MHLRRVEEKGRDASLSPRVAMRFTQGRHEREDTKKRRILERASKYLRQDRYSKNGGGGRGVDWDMAERQEYTVRDV